MKKFFITPFLALLVAASALAVRGQVAANMSRPDQSIRLAGADGRTYDVADMRGQIVLVSFGATWCQPCKEELKALEQLKKEYGGKPVKFLWVSVDTADEVSDSDLRSYAKKLKVTFPVLRDPERTTFARFSERLRLPTILFFDKSGRLSAPNQVGMAEMQMYLSKIRARLDRLLADGPAGGPARGN